MTNFNVLSFFAGAGGLDTGFHNAGFEVTWANEYDKKITPTLRANFPTTTVDDRSLFDIPSNEIPSDTIGIVGGPPCFPAGHMVLTEDGYKDISEIVIGDVVMTHTGQYKRVFDFGSKTSGIIEVKITGSPAIKCTPNHPFYVVEKINKDSLLKGSEETNYVFSEPHWLPASELKGNHYVLSPLDSARGESAKNLTEKEAYFIGRWLGDGWLRKTDRTGSYSKTLKSGKKIYRKSGYKKTIYICCNKTEKDDLNTIFAEMFDTFHFTEERTVYKFASYSTRMFSLLEDFGKGAFEKNIPNWVFSEPLNIQKELLEGYMDSDGSNNKGINNATTISFKLALGVQRLVRNVYKINPSITKFVRPKQTYIEGRLVNQKDTYQVRWHDVGNKPTTVFDTVYTYSKVITVLDKGHEEEIFNFSVEEDESYTINNFAVHNCQSWSLGGLGKGLGDKRGQVFLQYLRVIKDKQPLFFLAENVKGMLAKTRKADLDTLLVEMNALGYNLSYKLLNARDYGVPEDRWRVIFVGYHKSLGKSFEFPEPTDSTQTLKTAIWDLRNSATAALEKDTPNAKLAIANHEYSTGTFSSQYMSRNRCRLWDEPSFTIQASGRQAPLHPVSGKMKKISEDVHVFADPDKMRRLSVRETARIQTFPDDYKFVYNKVDIGYKMIGNAVPVKFAEVLATSIMKDIEAHFKGIA